MLCIDTGAGPLDTTNTAADAMSKFYGGQFGLTKVATVKFAVLPKSFWPKWSDCFDLWKIIQYEFLQVN